MKHITVSLLAGAAALASSAAMAADLPVKAKAVEYVKICSLYGAGFYYMPGTDTCVRFSGYLRFDVTGHGSTQNNPAISGSLGANDRFAHDFATRSRFQFNVDLRTQTNYGVVRVFGQTDWNFDTYAASGGINPGALASAGAAGTLNNHTPGNGYVAVEQLFLQFAGFTFGKSISARSVPWNGSLANNNTSSFFGGPDYVTGVNNVQYTYQWGNGVSTTIGLDESIAYNRTNLANVTAGVAASAASNGFTGTAGLTAITTPSGFVVSGLGTATNQYGGQKAPDIVGNFKIDQAWGIFTVAGNTHLVNASYYDQLNELSGHPDDKWGGSVTAGLQINNVPTGPGDRFTVDATYAKGDTKSVISTTGASPNFAIFGGGITGATYQSIGLGYTTDGLFAGNSPLNGTSIQLTTAWGIRAAFIHNWTKEVQSSLFGSYSSIDYNGTATALYCNAFNRTNTRTGGATTPNAGQTLSNPLQCNPDFNVYQIGFRTGWTPVSGLTFSGEVMYVGLDQKMVGTMQSFGALSGSLAKPAATYNFKDQQAVSVNFRVQRNF